MSFSNKTKKKSNKVTEFSLVSLFMSSSSSNNIVIDKNSPFTSHIYNKFDKIF